MYYHLFSKSMRLCLAIEYVFYEIFFYTQKLRLKSLLARFNKNLLTFKYKFTLLAKPACTFDHSAPRHCSLRPCKTGYSSCSSFKQLLTHTFDHMFDHAVTRNDTY